MPVPGFDGSGNYVRQYSWVTDKTNGVNITSSRMDTEDNGFASGLTLAVTRDGQGKMAADFVPSADAAYKLGSVALRWTDLNLSGNASIGGTASITGKLTLGGGLAVTGDSIARGIAVCKFKSSTTSRTNNTVSADPDLQYAIPGAGTYAFELFLICPTNVGGLQLYVAYSGTVTAGGYFEWGVQGGSFTSGITSVLAINGGGTSHSGAGGNDVLIIKGTLVAGNAGIISLGWGQFSTNAAATSMNAGSYLTVTQLS